MATQRKDPTKKIRITMPGRPRKNPDGTPMLDDKKKPIVSERGVTIRPGSDGKPIIKKDGDVMTIVKADPDSSDQITSSQAAILLGNGKAVMVEA